MAGIDKIIARIKKDSEQKAEEILAGAKAETDEILSDAKKEAEKRKKWLVQKGEREALQEKQRIISDARLKARKLEWRVKEELIAQVMNDAKQRIRKVKEGGFQGKDYSVILCDLIKEAAMSAGGGDLEVLLSEDEGKYVSQCDLDEIAEEVGKTCIVLSDGTLTGLGGVIIKTKDGRIEVNNTFEKRIERHSSTLRAEIVKVLWGE